MGKIITFYSYKGGVGRTMALSNAAILLSRWNYNVLVVDWDLEAPGVEFYFEEFIDSKKLIESKGIIDLIQNVQEQKSSANSVNWDELYIEIKVDESSKPIHFLTSGHRMNGYFRSVAELDLDDFYSKKNGGLFIESLRNEWKEKYDFILIDSRTGVTDMNSVCTVQLPDILVLFFSATKQSLHGIIDIADKINLAHQKLPFDRFRLLSIPIPNRFDLTVEFKISQEWLSYFSMKLSKMFYYWLPKNINILDFIKIIKIPYIPYFSFGEKLAVLEQGTIDQHGLGYAYETLATLIANKLENVEKLLDNRSEYVKAASGASILDSSKYDDFLSYLELICRLRQQGEAAITRIRGKRQDYLKICVRDGNITRIYPLGAEEETLTEESFQDFLTHVVPKYRSADPTVIPEFVHGGAALPADSPIHELARREQVRLYSFIEYQGLMDFRNYVRLQTERLNNDPVYPPELYVPQQIRVSRGREHFDSEALPALLKWLDEPDGRFILILGEFGTGKTFLLRQAARQLGERQNHLIPLLLEMRFLEKSKSLDKLVAQHLAEYMPYDARKFRYMLEQGRVALLFDGFDELALRVTYDKAAEHFDTLLEAARGKFAKVAVTSRTQHFISDKQVKQKLMEKAETVSKHRVVELQRFDANQIRQFLRNALKDETAAERRFALIGRIKDLMGLSANPRMLGFIAELPKEDLQQAEQRKGQITAAGLYQLLLERWLRGEQKRVAEGFKDDLQIQDRWRAVIMLALALWERTSPVISKDELTEQVWKHLKLLLDVQIATWQIGSGTLLIRDTEGNFGFIHQSVMEWLTAKAAVFLAFRSPPDRHSRESSESDDDSMQWHTILSPLFQKEGDFINPLSRKEISPLMAEFFKDLAGHEPALDWARAVLDDAEASEIARKNAFKILDRL